MKKGLLILFGIGILTGEIYAKDGSHAAPRDMKMPMEAAHRTSVDAASGSQGDDSTPALAAALGIEFVKNSHPALIITRDGRKYMVDPAAQSIRELDPSSRSQERASAAVPAEGSPGVERARAEPAHRAASGTVPQAGSGGTAIFKSKCAQCHGADGRGTSAIKTPNFTDPKLQASLTDETMIEIITHGKKDTMMPAWKGKLSADEIRAVQGYVRSLGSPKSGSSTSGAGSNPDLESKIYKPGDDLLMSLPTGRRLDRHGVYVNFTHRFVFDPAFSGTARGGALSGLDGFSLSSFGFRYGVTDKLSVSIYRSPTFIARPIQMMAAYNFLDEHDGQPLNAAIRVSIEGQNNFNRNFTENIEGILSRSITPRAQIYFVPTVSFNDRHLFSPSSFESSAIPTLPGYNAVSLGVGAAIDIRPTVALLVEVIPTVVNGRPLDIHRPAYSFGIQKKIWRHSFTLGFTTSPGTTVSQRGGTRASFLGDPGADKPGGLVIGFDLTRQLH